MGRMMIEMIIINLIIMGGVHTDVCSKSLAKAKMEWMNQDHISILAYDGDNFGVETSFIVLS